MPLWQQLSQPSIPLFHYAKESKKQISNKNSYQLEADWLWCSLNMWKNCWFPVKNVQFISKWLWYKDLSKYHLNKKELNKKPCFASSWVLLWFSGKIVLPPLSTDCFHPPAPPSWKIILQASKMQHRAQVPFLYIAATLRQEPAVIFTASGLLAISFSIDSPLEPIDFWAGSARTWGGRMKRQRILPLKCMIHQFLFLNSSGFQNIPRCRHQV